MDVAFHIGIGIQILESGVFQVLYFHLTKTSHMLSITSTSHYN